jgi:hypothetical protein
MRHNKHSVTRPSIFKRKSFYIGLILALLVIAAGIFSTTSITKEQKATQQTKTFQSSVDKLYLQKSVSGPDIQKMNAEIQAMTKSGAYKKYTAAQNKEFEKKVLSIYAHAQNESDRIYGKELAKYMTPR